MQQIYDTTTPDSKVEVIDVHCLSVIFSVYRSSPVKECFLRDRTGMDLNVIARK